MRRPLEDKFQSTDTEELLLFWIYSIPKIKNFVSNTQTF
jgi:hypothetical protein